MLLSSNSNRLDPRIVCQITILLILMLISSAPGIALPEGSALNTERKPPEAGILDFRKGKTPKIDGIDSPGEWSDAGTTHIIVRAGWKVTVRYKHDGANLFFGFRDVADPEKLLSRVPEVVFDMLNDRKTTWNEDDWWFHVSARDCQSQGRFNDYKTCLLEAAGWEANNQRGMEKPEIFEIRIPYTYIGLKRGRETRFGIAINVTDTKTTWNFWPQNAVLANPSSWGEAISSDGW